MLVRSVLVLALVAVGAAEENGVLPGHELEELPPREALPEGAEIPFGTPGGMIPVAPKSLKIDNNGPITVDMSAGTLTYLGSVEVRADTGLQMFADRMVLDTRNETLTLDGNVSIYQGPLLKRGDHAVYNYGKKQLVTTGMRVSIDPILLEAGRFRAEDRDGKTVYVGENAGITTHDYQDPNYWIRAKKTTVYPGDKVVFENLKAYAGEVPVFWFPYLAQPLNAELGYHFIPGARSSWGAYLLNTYGIMLGEGGGDFFKDDQGDPWLLSRWHADLRTRRGAAIGLDLLDTRLDDNPAMTGLEFYYAYDFEPDISRSGIPRGIVNEDRWRLNFRHRFDFDWEQDADWSARFNISKLSDRYFLEDYDPETYRIDPEPDNTIGLFRQDDSSLLGFYTRLPLNSFNQTASRLPEIFFDQAKRPIFGSPILHEGHTSVGIYREELSNPAKGAILNTLRTLPPGDPRIPTLTAMLQPDGFNRFHTYHEFSWPTNLGGWLTLVPRAGIGYTNYWAVDNPGYSTDRTHLHAGIEASMKFSKTYPDVHNDKLGLDGLLHVFQPYANYSYLATDDLSPGFPKVDRLTFSTRPRTLSAGSFTALDSLRDWNIVRMGFRNRLVTKRNDRNHEWLTMDTYMDAFIQDPEFDRNYSNLYNDLYWYPLPWFRLGLETQFPLIDGGSGFHEFNTVFSFMPNENIEFTLRHRLLENHPVLLDTNHLDLRGYARLNENWGVGMLHMWELDDGTLEVQQYTLHRDFDNWVMGLGFTKRDNRIENEYGVVLSLTLKDFPSVSLPFRIDAE